MKECVRTRHCARNLTTVHYNVYGAKGHLVYSSYPFYIWGFMEVKRSRGGLGGVRTLNFTRADQGMQMERGCEDCASCPYMRRELDLTRALRSFISAILPHFAPMRAKDASRIHMDYFGMSWSDLDQSKECTITSTCIQANNSLPSRR